MDKDYIKKQIEALKIKPNLNRKERKLLRRLERKSEQNNISQVKNYKQYLTKAVLVIIFIAVFGRFIWYAVTRPNLPPTDLQGHVEENPPAHIMDKPMPESIQKHMLEHADGKGAPGVIIQYNCQKYTCGSDLVEKLKTIVDKYPQNVYLAPGSYDGKIILTRLGKREILADFDEDRMIDFID